MIGACKVLESATRLQLWMQLKSDRKERETTEWRVKWESKLLFLGRDWRERSMSFCLYKGCSISKPKPRRGRGNIILGERGSAPVCTKKGSINEQDLYIK